MSRFTTEGELPVIQSAHNEELAALKLKMKKVGKKLWIKKAKEKNTTDKQ